MFGFVLALVVASHGGEGSREEKFRGTLLAEAGSPAAIDRGAAQRELDNLIAERPDFLPSGVAMSIGGGFTVLGAIAFSIMAAAGASSAAGIISLVVGMVAVPGGLIVGIVAGLVMISVAVDRGVIDQRIRVLRGVLERPVDPPLPPPAPPSVFAPSSLLQVARF